MQNQFYDLDTKPNASSESIHRTNGFYAISNNNFETRVLFTDNLCLLDKFIYSVPQSVRP